MAAACLSKTVCLVVVLGYVSGATMAEVKENSSNGAESVALMWGIADTTASVGRVFKYHIPADAFKGEVSKYEVVEAGKDSLPAWLHFAPGLNVLKGIPTPADAGQLYLEVIAYGPDGQKATDVFSVFISADSATMSSSQPLKVKKSGPEVVRCKREQPETVATIVVDADFEGMTVQQRLELLSKFLSHMGLLEEVVKVIPAKVTEDDAALVTGTGDAKEPQHPGVSLSWLVGCGKVEQGHFPILQKLDDDSGSGAMSKALGRYVVGWRVTNTRLQQQQKSQKRRRRQALATPTPVITIAPPTATDTAVDVDTTDADTMMTRKVVDMASPTFSIQPSPIEPVMPKTVTPTTPSTTPKMDKPEVIQPSRSVPVSSEATKTEPLPPVTSPPTTPSTKPTTVTTITTRKPKDTTKKPTKPKEPVCLKPDVNVEIDKVTAIAGELFTYQIPEETFSACGKGGTSETKLSLFKDTSTKLSEDWFLEFDQKTQIIQGMPMDEDVGIHTLTLVAMLKDQAFIATTSFKLHVRKAKGRKSRVNHELSLTLDTDYEQFANNLTKKIDLLNKVAGVFGDEDTSAISVTRITPGSVVYAFTNNTLSGNGCPVEDITELADKLITPDGNLNQDAVKKLKPWILMGAATAPAGDCEDDPDFPRRSATLAMPTTPSKTTGITPDMTKKPETGKPVEKTDSPTAMPERTSKPRTTSAAPNGTGVLGAGKTSEDNILITTVVPAVVIVVILLFALVVACILYRKKRKGKMNLEDQNTFVNKGAPVIFPDELDDKPNDSTKPLLIEGSPPAPPPEYQRGSSESPERRNGRRDATPPTDEMDADIETDVHSPLYQPPPPVTASSGKQARPHVQQPYRSQPPEIHP